MGKSLSSDSARARSQKQKEASRRAGPDTRERIPTGAGGAARPYPETGDSRGASCANNLSKRGSRPLTRHRSRSAFCWRFPFRLALLEYF